MTEGVIVPVLIFAAMGILSSAILVVAAKFMFVKKDETTEKIRAVLPGANCGACGYVGCDDYAAAIAKGGVKTNLCVPGGDKCSRDISDVLGTAFEDVEEMVAAVHCSGTCHTAKKAMDYSGIKTCAASTLFFGGTGVCKFACLGFGDCVDVCQYDAIHVTDGVAKVDREMCTGCGMCAHACPKSLIEIVDANKHVFVACNSKDKGAVTRVACSSGCIACKICEKKCRYDAIHVTDNLARIDYEKCTNCGECVAVCPVKVIHMENGSANVNGAS